MDTGETRGNKNTLAGEPKTRTITFANGQRYELSNMTIGKINLIEQHFDKNMSKLFVDIRAEVMIYCLYILLRTKYPEITEEFISENIEGSQIMESYKLIVEMMG